MYKFEHVATQIQINVKTNVKSFMLTIYIPTPVGMYDVTNK
jgi:hypothetical protein